MLLLLNFYYFKKDSISCSTQESKSYTSTGQQSRAGPEGAYMGQLTLRTNKQENWPCLLLITVKGELVRAVLDSSPGGWKQRRAGGLTNPVTTQAQNQGYVLTHPSSCPICDLLEHHESSGWGFKGVVRHEDPGLQDTHITGHQQDIQEESEGQVSINGVAENNSLESDQCDSLKCSIKGFTA